MKRKAKYKQAKEFVGRVGEHELRATGRTKREAEKRLRKMFSARGIHTRPDPTVDNLRVYCR